MLGKATTMTTTTTRAGLVKQSTLERRERQEQQLLDERRAVSAAKQAKEAAAAAVRSQCQEQRQLEEQRLELGAVEHAAARAKMELLEVRGAEAARCVGGACGVQADGA